jgi:predicted ATPase
MQDHPLQDVVQDLRIHRQCAELDLSFLSETAVADYLSIRFPGLALPDGLAQLLYERTAGNPLFMINVVDAWLTQAALVEALMGTAPPGAARKAGRRRAAKSTRIN